MRDDRLYIAGCTTARCDRVGSCIDVQNYGIGTAIACIQNVGLPYEDVSVDGGRSLNEGNLKAGQCPLAADCFALHLGYEDLDAFCKAVAVRLFAEVRNRNCLSSDAMLVHSWRLTVETSCPCRSLLRISFKRCSDNCMHATLLHDSAYYHRRVGRTPLVHDKDGNACCTLARRFIGPSRIDESPRLARIRGGGESLGRSRCSRSVADR